jgi:AhpD family alkylhydroperoxidase
MTMQISTDVDGAVVELLGPRDAPLLAQGFYSGGDPGPIVASMAHVPELLEVALPFIGATLGASSIAFRTKEIVILRTSVLLGCRFCVASHTPVALDSGLSHIEVHALRNETPIDDAFGAVRDRLLIAWTDAVAGNQPVPDKLTLDMRADFAEHEIVELTLLVGCTLLLNRYATALRLPVGSSTTDRLEAEGMVLL